MAEGRETTKQRMLEAGIDLWTEESAAELFAGLSVARVARTAGVTRSTFYAYWSSTDEYLLDLTRHLAGPGWDSYPDNARTGAAALRSVGTKLVDRFLAACDRHMEALIADPRLRVRLGLTAKLDDPEIADCLREVIAQAETTRSETFAQLMPIWGRVPRRPFEAQHISTMFTSMADGFAVRHILEPERYPLEVFGLSSLALLFITTARTKDSRDAYSTLEIANDWANAALTDVATTNGDGRLSDEDVRQIVIEARRLASMHSWSNLTFTALATVTNLPEERVTRAFGSKMGLGMALYMLNLSERYEDLRPTDDALADLRTILEINTDELQRSPALTQSMVVLIADGATFVRPSDFSFDTHPTLIAAVRRAQECGALDATPDAEQLATFFSRTILLACTPGPNPMGSADVVEMLLRGAGAAPQSIGGAPLA